MRRWAVVAASLCVGGAARADGPDPHGLFGLDPVPATKPVAPPPSCTEGTTFGCASATDELADLSPTGVRTVLSRSYLLTLPIARHDTLAGFAAGVNRDDAGPAFGGATGLENRWTIDGAPSDSLRTGGVELRVPVTFLDSLLLGVGGFTARERVSTGGTIDARLRRGSPTHIVDAYAWGGYNLDSPRRPIPNGAYTVRRATVDVAPSATLSVLASGPLPPDVWYVLGIAPVLAPLDYTWRAARLADADSDGMPDGFPGQVQTTPIETTRERSLDYSIPALARLGWDHGVHSLDATLVGQVAREGSFLGNATLDTAIARSSFVGDAIATWQGRWPHTRGRVQVSWHRSQRTDHPRTGDANAVELLSAYIPGVLGTDPTLATACTDSMDPTLDSTPALTNCPVPVGFFASGGAGLLTEQVGDRPSATADIAHAVGNHVARVGVTAEDSRLVTTSRFTGGARVRSLFPGHTDTQQFYGATCEATPGAPCDYVDEQELRYRARYAAAYVEDTAVVEPRLRLDGGIRYELMEVGSALRFRHQIAPRFGFAWDFAGQGASRLWASYARSYAILPAGLGATVLAANHTVRDVVSPVGNGRVLDQGVVAPVAAGIEPVTQDEGTVGIAVGQPGLAQASAWVQGRSLRRGLETVSLSREDFTIGFDNPGHSGTEPNARRDTLVAAMEVAVVPSRTMAVRAGYSYTRAAGNWTGPFDPRQGANLYASTDFDLDRTNLDGRLPTDAAHRLFVEGSHTTIVHGIALTGGLRATVNNGRPRNFLSDSDQGLVYLLPRGSGGRNATVSQLNLRISAKWHGTDVTLDAFNVFDHHTVTNLDEVYSGLTTRPIVGGDESDLVFLRYEGGDVATRRTAFHVPTTFQAPFSATLGIHRAF